MPQQRAGFLATNTGAIPFSAHADGEYIMRNTGRNVGNMAFWYATREMFDDPAVFIEWAPDGKRYRDDVDLLVIPAANHLSPQWDMKVLAGLIESLDKEVIVFGLGAQAQDEKQTLELSEGTVRYLHALSDHAKTIFVRGVYTAEVCNKLGVMNVEPIGCPSITINPDPDLGALVASRYGEVLQRLYCAGASFKEENKLIERALFAKIESLPGSTYVIQDPAELIDCALGLRPEAVVSPVEERARFFLKPDATMAEFRLALMKVGRTYDSIRAWLADAARHQFSINTRIHGGILSFMAGVPSLVIAHDTRIRELCEIMLIPYLRPGEAVKRLESIEQLFASVPFDGAAFDANRGVIARRYQEYLKGSGLTPSQNLKRLSGNP